MWGIFPPASLSAKAAAIRMSTPRSLVPSEADLVARRTLEPRRTPPRGSGEPGVELGCADNPPADPEILVNRAG